MIENSNSLDQKTRFQAISDLPRGSVTCHQRIARLLVYTTYTKRNRECKNHVVPNRAHISQ